MDCRKHYWQPFGIILLHAWYKHIFFATIIICCRQLVGTVQEAHLINLMDLGVSMLIILMLYLLSITITIGYKNGISVNKKTTSKISFFKIILNRGH